MAGPYPRQKLIMVAEDTMNQSSADRGEVKLSEVMIGALTMAPKAVSRLKEAANLESIVWRVVLICAFVGFVSSLIVLGLQNFGLLPMVQADEKLPEFAKSIGFKIALGSLAIVLATVLGYPLLQVIWRRIFGFDGQRSGVTAALGLGYAFSTWFTLPSQVLTALNTNPEPSYADWSLFLAVIPTIATSVYFTRTTDLNYGKSFLLNFATLAMTFAALIVLSVIGALLYVALAPGFRV
jgi:hypothetical protein